MKFQRVLHTPSLVFFTIVAMIAIIMRHFPRTGSNHRPIRLRPQSP